jgi:hypothetical protein
LEKGSGNALTLKSPGDSSGQEIIEPMSPFDPELTTATIC